MPQLYHARGIIRPLLGPGLRHVARLSLSAEYRALQRWHWRFRRWPRRQPGEVWFAHRRIRFVDAASLLSAFAEIFVNRIYDVGPIDHEPFFIDAGANIGLAQLYWKRRYGVFQCVGFEPDPEIVRVLRLNLTEWACGGAVYAAALGGTEGEAPFCSDGTDAGRMLDRDAPGSVPVPVRRLSRFIDRRVDLLKVDIEGAELAVFREIEARLHLVDRVFVECHSYVERPQDFMDVLAILRRAGFRCYPRAARGPRHPFLQAEISDGMDLNLNVWGIRA